MVNTEQVIRHIIKENLPLTLVVNKVDRLILELKLPPSDVYYKLKHVIEEINTLIKLVHFSFYQLIIYLEIELLIPTGNDCLLNEETCALRLVKWDGVSR
jgi:translation elongation factor EF-G